MRVSASGLRQKKGASQTPRVLVGKWKNFGGAISPNSKTKLRPLPFRAPNGPKEPYTWTVKTCIAVMSCLNSPAAVLEKSEDKPFGTHFCGYKALLSSDQPSQGA